MMSTPRRRTTRRSNPAVSLRAIRNGVSSSIAPGIGASLGILGGWSFAKTALGGRDQGFLGYGANVVGGGLTAAILGLVTRNSSIMRGAFAGAIAAPVLRIIVEQIRMGTIRLPLGIRTGFEGYTPGTGMSDYLVSPPATQAMAGYHLPEAGLMNDYLVGSGQVHGTDVFSKYGGGMREEAAAI